jgi:hypothetical protein
VTRLSLNLDKISCNRFSNGRSSVIKKKASQFGSVCRNNATKKKNKQADKQRIGERRLKQRKMLKHQDLQVIKPSIPSSTVVSTNVRFI